MTDIKPKSDKMVDGRRATVDKHINGAEFKTEETLIHGRIKGPFS